MKSLIRKLRADLGQKNQRETDGHRDVRVVGPSIGQHWLWRDPPQGQALVFSSALICTKPQHTNPIPAFLT